MTRRALRRVVTGTGIALLATAGLLQWAHGEAVAAPTVRIVPLGAGASAGPSFDDGETVGVSVGANTVFTPRTRVNILECADPGGTAAALPKSVSGCDGDTIQGDTVLVQADGSVSEARYTMYRLPSTTLGEAPDVTPVCDQSHQCVLYVGEDQTDFTKAKLFSAPFAVAGTAGDAAGASASATAQSSVTLSASASAATTPGPATDPAAGTLASTGAPASLPGLLAVGGGLILVGSAGRRLAGRRLAVRR
ncbi:MAG TPA: hypothetical protein VMF60_04540 [Acidimicrobiales bacterium]|nr:hypothetical protein [Acidimicrobiales bacterium]